MKKNHFVSILTAVCIMAVMMSGCKKEDGDVVTIKGRMAQFGNSKVTMDGYMPEWENGDEVYTNDANIHVKQCTVSADRSVAEWKMANAAIYQVIYPADMVTGIENDVVSMTIPKYQYYVDNGNGQVVKAPMGSCSQESDLYFKNLGALLAISIQNSSSNDMVVDKVVVRSLGETDNDNGIVLWGNAVVENFNAMASEYYYRITDAPNTNNEDHCKVELVRESSSPLFTLPAGVTKVVYVYVPADVNCAYNRYQITVNATAGSEDVSVTKTQSVSNPHGGALQRNDMASVTFPMASMTYPDDAVQGGVFSVSDDDGQHVKRVFFSKGNLQYNAAQAQWRFATNQYDFVGATNSQIGSSYNGWTDLFGWATSGIYSAEYYASDAYWRHYMPYDISTETVSNGRNKYGYGPSFFTGCTNDQISLVGNRAFLDWGSAVSNDDITWRTLTGKEFYYLLYQRLIDGTHCGEHFNYDNVTCNGVSGLLIYPDGYTRQLTSAELSAGITTVPEGCAFLPAAGYRDGSSNTIYFPGDFYYWTASAGALTSTLQYATPSAAATKGAGTLARNGNEYQIVSKTRYYGQSVRVVSDYND